MAESDTSMSCTAKSWSMAVLGGLVIGLVVWVVSSWGFAASLMLAIVIALIVGLFLSLTVCSGSNTPEAPAAKSPATASPTPAEKPDEKVTSEAPSAAGKDAPASSVKPTSSLPGQAELASRKGTWKYDKDGDTVPDSDAPATEKAPAKASAAPAPAVSETSEADAAPAKPKAKRAAVAPDGKPELLDTPRPEGADDLKLIGGVGPKLEQTLNELGIWHFSQVAGWRKKEIAWVDSRLRFKGRIERDDWMSQAKILAKGGETEFSRKKKK